MSLPALFISHGAPDTAVTDMPATRFLRQLGERLEPVDNIVLVTSHWLTHHPLLSAQAQPATLHDFYWGPDPALYAMEYPAKGNPQLAEEIALLLANNGIAAGIDVQRDMDHGVWTPLVHLKPKAEIPVVALSTQPYCDTRHHLAVGRALAPLREKGVLIIGSGAVTHDLRGIGGSCAQQAARSHALEFSQWVNNSMKTKSLDALLNYEKEGPHAAINHPTPEHLLPLFVAMGAAEDGPWRRIHSSWSYGVLAMDIYSFG